MESSKKEKVYLALSGGVDSSVSAALLKEQGYEVTGVFMKNWSGDNYGLQADCPWENDQKDAEAVCNHLNIPFRSFNFEKEYRAKVVEYFFIEYEAGRTPNPDVMCNKEIKFGIFLERAIQEGADLVATGHYAQKVSSSKFQTPNSEDHTQQEDNFCLAKGKDPKKDQTYFLHRLTQEQLTKTLFPIGHLPKPEVRELARKFKLPNAEKPDSQGICFIGEINVHDFIKQRLGEKEGEIIDIDTEKVVGHHKGSYFYTIGQREGLGIGGTKEPYFVVDTNVEENKVYVGMGTNHPALFTKTVFIENLHLINSKIEFPIYNQTNFDTYELIQDNQISNTYSQLSASIRYRHKPEAGKLVPLEQGQYKFVFETPQRAVTPGQSLVIYQNEICIGGGIII